MNEDLKKAVIAAGQGHLLRYTGELSQDELAQFTAQLEAVDWSQIPALSA